MMDDQQFTYAAIEPSTWATSKPAGQVRWVRRNGELVLQQGWEITTYVGNSPTGMHAEWRDVPTEDATRGQCVEPEVK